LLVDELQNVCIRLIVVNRQGAMQLQVEGMRRTADQSNP